jgi:hypothetical protein
MTTATAWIIYSTVVPSVVVAIGWVSVLHEREARRALDRRREP